jgi:hypothetical protein
MTMGYCDIHNWSSHGFKKCPQCVKEENTTSEENDMSKMSDYALVVDERDAARRELDIMHHNFRSQGEEVLQLRDELTTKAENYEQLLRRYNAENYEQLLRRYNAENYDQLRERYEAEDVSGCTNTTTGFAKPANGYVMLDTDNDSWCKYSSLDEMITDSVPAFFDARGFNNGNQVYELGMQVRPVTEIKWEKVK